MTYYGPPQGQPDPYGQPQVPLHAQPGPPYPQQQWQPHGYQPPAAQVPPPWASKHNGFGIAALVVGIIALVAPLVIAWGFWLGLVAVILAGVGLSKAKIGTASNRGMSRVSMILGLLAMALSFILLLVAQNSRPTQAEMTECVASAKTADEIWACTD